MGFNRAQADKAGIRVGDEVRITLEKDEAPRAVAPPPELARALRSDAAAKKAWEALSYSHQREHAEAIEAAKRPETRERRVQKTLEMLTTTGQPARPAVSAKPLGERLQLKPGMKLAVLDAPRGFSLGVPTTAKLAGALDGVVLFAPNSAALKARARELKKLPASTIVWIAYPKTSSKVATDLTRDDGWDAVKGIGLSPVRQVAIDETWSALRFRKKD